MSFDLTLAGSAVTVSAFRTSSTEQNAELGEVPLTEEGLIVSLPPRSVTTLVIQDVVVSNNENLINNADFEDPGKGGWFLLFGEREDKAINGNYVYLGQFSGYLDFGPSELSLMQNITAQISKTYYLSVRVATSSSNAVFGVLLNGAQGPETKIEAFKGYQPYGMSFQANAQDVISVYVYGRRGSDNAQIDEVVLH